MSFSEKWCILIKGRAHNQCEQYAQQAAPDGQTAARFGRRCHWRCAACCVMRTMLHSIGDQVLPA